MPYISEEDIQLAKDHIKLLQDFQADLIKENCKLWSSFFEERVKETTKEVK